MRRYFSTQAVKQKKLGNINVTPHNPDGRPGYFYLTNRID